MPVQPRLHRWPQVPVQVAAGEIRGHLLGPLDVDPGQYPLEQELLGVGRPPSRRPTRAVDQAGRECQ